MKTTRNPLNFNNYDFWSIKISLIKNDFKAMNENDIVNISHEKEKFASIYYC